MMCQRIGIPPISTIGLGRTSVSSARRVPKPPARIPTFMLSPSELVSWMCSRAGVFVCDIERCHLSREVVWRKGTRLLGAPIYSRLECPKNVFGQFDNGPARPQQPKLGRRRDDPDQIGDATAELRRLHRPKENC